ncbi:hypothetical protein H5410_040229 [Solanum commersonii]|uniref:MADS-box domain-containing protein n=1 Tax=Solanum commersonii TaxID=4109 RepID=A0A9J5XNA4_SOLCO|nr:hypothetical protein H5410_040229 [Solanum commersonii]
MSKKVSFSKRRASIYKKANELCTMCGAKIVIVGFTPGNNIYSFGTLHKILLIFLTKSLRLIKKRKFVRRIEIKRKEELQAIKRDTASGQHWWKAPIEDLNYP